MCLYANENTVQVTEFPGRVPHAHSVIVQRTFCVYYTVKIRFVRYTSVTRTLVGRSLPVTCSVRMHSLRLLRRHVSTIPVLSHISGHL